MIEMDWYAFAARRRARRYLERQVNRGRPDKQRVAAAKGRALGTHLKVLGRYVDGEGKDRVAASRARAADKREVAHA